MNSMDNRQSPPLDNCPAGRRLGASETPRRDLLGISLETLVAALGDQTI